MHSAQQFVIQRLTTRSLKIMIQRVWNCYAAGEHVQGQKGMNVAGGAKRL
jgi:hypothetical protein